MGLIWPGFLILLGIIPLIGAAYIWVLRRRRRNTLRYSSLSLLRGVLPRQSRLRRHLPFALFLLALASLVLALTRPVAAVTVPAGQTTVILAIDVSRSMCSTDIPPNRLEAAKEAALSFIQRQESHTQIGIVAFAGFAVLIQPPTNDQDALEYAIEGLTTARRTAIGSGILKSLDAIAAVNNDVAPSVSDMSPGVQPTPVPEGVFAPDIIVLLTDGVSNSGIWPLDAAQQAADRGIRVYTIGFGTADGSMMRCDNRFDSGGWFGGGGQFGSGFRRGIDEETLMQIADMTGGKYYAATNANELHGVFRELPTYYITKTETMEISVAFAAIGALLAAIAILLSQIWHPLP
jgi:Ca-activated chloride channel family protein